MKCACVRVGRWAGDWALWEFGGPQHDHFAVLGELNFPDFPKKIIMAEVAAQQEKQWSALEIRGAELKRGSRGC